jgi:alkylhydroperoxidase family enzyme
MQAGADEEKVREVPTWRESRRFSDAERVAFEYAEAMTITGQRVGDELFARLRSFYDEAQIVELTAAVALENFRSKANVALQVQAQGFCALPGLQTAADAGNSSTESATLPQQKSPAA